MRVAVSTMILSVPSLMPLPLRYARRPIVEQAGEDVKPWRYRITIDDKAWAD
jgi:hypothetical protein